MHVLKLLIKAAEMSAEHMLYSYLIANFLSTHIKVRCFFKVYSNQDQGRHCLLHTVDKK